MLYEDGTCMDVDFKQAAHWYRKAADQGHASAQNNLARLYEKGAGVLQSPTGARSWYQAACNSGERMACANLAKLYGGGGGLRPDDALAYFWARVAMLTGTDEPGISEELLQLLRSRLAGADAARIEAQAQKWLDGRKTSQDDGVALSASARSR